jgi:hypothetical protein
VKNRHDEAPTCFFFFPSVCYFLCFRSKYSAILFEIQSVPKVDVPKRTHQMNSYSKTNKMHQFLKLFILVKHSTCFGRSFCPSSGVQGCSYSNRHMSTLDDGQKDRPKLLECFARINTLRNRRICWFYYRNILRCT